MWNTTKFLSEYEKFRKHHHFYSHETDILRLLILHQFGGVYLDTDMYINKPLPISLINVLGTDENLTRIPTTLREPKGANGAIMIFEKGNAFLHAALSKIILSYGSERMPQSCW